MRDWNRISCERAKDTRVSFLAWAMLITDIADGKNLASNQFFIEKVSILGENILEFLSNPYSI